MTNILAMSQVMPDFSTGVAQTRADVMPVFTPPSAEGDIIELMPNSPSSVMPVKSR